MERSMTLLTVAALLLALAAAGTADARGHGRDDGYKATITDGPYGEYYGTVGLFVDPKTFNSLKTATSYSKSGSNALGGVDLHVYAAYAADAAKVAGSSDNRKGRRLLLDQGTVTSSTSASVSFATSPAGYLAINERSAASPTSSSSSSSSSSGRSSLSAARSAKGAASRYGGIKGGCSTTATVRTSGVIGSTSWTATYTNGPRFLQVYTSVCVGLKSYLPNTPAVTYTPCDPGTSCDFALVTSQSPSSVAVAPSCVVVYSGVATRSLTWGYGLASTIEQFESTSFDSRTLTCSFTSNKPTYEFPCGCFTNSATLAENCAA